MAVPSSVASMLTSPAGVGFDDGRLGFGLLIFLRGMMDVLSLGVDGPFASIEAYRLDS